MAILGRNGVQAVDSHWYTPSSGMRPDSARSAVAGEQATSMRQATTPASKFLGLSQEWVEVQRVAGISQLPLPNNLGGNAANNRIGWHIAHNHRPCHHDSPLADGDTAQDCGAHANPGIVADDNWS